MKSLASGLAAAIASDTTRLAYIVGITCWNGFAVYVTDNDQDITLGGTIFKADKGCSVSQVRSVLGTSAQSCSVEIMLTSDGVTPALLDGGIFDDARVLVELVDWSNPSLGTIKQFLGFISQGTYKDRLTVVFDCQPLLSRNKTLASETFSSNCRADLGDARCTVDIDALKVITAITVASTRQIIQTADASGTNHWQAGLAAFTSGQNAGISVEIANNDATGGIVLRGILPYAPAVGDAVILYPGCDKTPETCINTYSNMANFRGEPFAVAPWVVTSAAAPASAPSGALPVSVPTPVPSSAAPALTFPIVNLVSVR